MPVSKSTRGMCAMATMAAGVCVAIAMQVAGGESAQDLPTAPLFQISAGLGAGLAGSLLADGFGWPRWPGYALAALSSVAATLSGAVMGAAIFLFVVAVKDPQLPPFELLGAAPLFGVIAITDGLLNSIPVAATWIVSMSGVHLLLRRVRLQDETKGPLST